MSKYYVSMTDKCLSGWGAAKGRISKFIIECDSLNEAERIKNNFSKREEMKYIKVSRNKPSYPVSRYHTSIIPASEATYS